MTRHASPNALSLLNQRESQSHRLLKRQLQADVLGNADTSGCLSGACSTYATR
jgi:hypothetical protein